MVVFLDIMVPVPMEVPPVIVMVAFALSDSLVTSEQPREYNDIRRRASIGADRCGNGSLDCEGPKVVQLIVLPKRPVNGHSIVLLYSLNPLNLESIVGSVWQRWLGSPDKLPTNRRPGQYINRL